MRVRVEDVSSSVFRIESADLLECAAAIKDLSAVDDGIVAAVPRSAATSKAKPGKASSKVACPIVTSTTESNISGELEHVTVLRTAGKRAASALRFRA